MNLHERAVHMNRNNSVLINIHREYDSVFEELISCKNPMRRKKLLEIENKLNNKCIFCQRDLGVLIPDFESKYTKSKNRKVKR